MKITIRRKIKSHDRTIGELAIDGKVMADTLELRSIDWSKEKKVAGKTAIPCGSYVLSMRWSNKFKRKMQFLEYVPFFTGIMIHPGNTIEDTRGCILVGLNYYGKLVRSKTYFEMLYSRIEKAMNDGEIVNVEIK